MVLHIHLVIKAIFTACVLSAEANRPKQKVDASIEWPTKIATFLLGVVKFGDAFAFVNPKRIANQISPKTCPNTQEALQSLFDELNVLSDYYEDDDTHAQKQRDQISNLNMRKARDNANVWLDFTNKFLQTLDDDLSKRGATLNDEWKKRMKIQYISLMALMRNNGILVDKKFLNIHEAQKDFIGDKSSLFAIFGNEIHEEINKPNLDGNGDSCTKYEHFFLECKTRAQEWQTKYGEDHWRYNIHGADRSGFHEETAFRWAGLDLGFFNEKSLHMWELDLPEKSKALLNLWEIVCRSTAHASPLSDEEASKRKQLHETLTELRGE